MKGQKLQTLLLWVLCAYRTSCIWTPLLAAKTGRGKKITSSIMFSWVSGPCLQTITLVQHRVPKMQPGAKHSFPEPQIIHRHRFCCCFWSSWKPSFRHQSDREFTHHLKVDFNSKRSKSVLFLSSQYHPASILAGQEGFPADSCNIFATPAPASWNLHYIHVYYLAQFWCFWNSGTKNCLLLPDVHVTMWNAIPYVIPFLTWSAWFFSFPFFFKSELNEKQYFKCVQIAW